MFSSEQHRYLVLSDSHGKADRIDTLLRRNRTNTSGIIFLGDGLSDLFRVMPDYPELVFYPVLGNCDSPYSAKLTQAESKRFLTLSSTKLLLTHGHLYGVKGSDLALLKEADACALSVVLHGHTHMARAEKALTPGGKTVLLANPGSLGDYFAPKFGVLEFYQNKPLFQIFEYLSE